MTTRRIDTDTPSVGGSVIESTGVGADATVVDVWCPGSVASAPSGVVSGGGGSAGLFGGSAGVEIGSVGGVVDVPAGSPIAGLGVDLVDVAGVVSDLL